MCRGRSPGSCARLDGMRYASVSIAMIRRRPTMSALLRDVLDIPEQAGAEDYVLRLTDSIEPTRWPAP